MKYPFEFNEMLLTPKSLDVLGFTDPWDLNGDAGTRDLDLGGKNYRIIETYETEDPDSGCGSDPYYHPCSILTRGWEKNLYFLHEMYEDVLERETADMVSVFIEITQRKGVNMYPYLKSYLEWKEKQS